MDRKMMLTITLPDHENVVVYVNPDENIGKIRDQLCHENSLDSRKYALTYRSAVLDEEKKIMDFSIPEAAVLRILEDLTEKEGRRIYVILKVEGAMNSTIFSKEATLWTVVERLVASETLYIDDSVPVLLHDDEEYIGRDELQAKTLGEVAPGESAVFSFKFRNKNAANQTDMSIRDRSSRADGFETSTSGNSLQSTSYASSAHQRCVAFSLQMDKGDSPDDVEYEEIAYCDAAENKPAKVVKCCSIV